MRGKTDTRFERGQWKLTHWVIWVRCDVDLFFRMKTKKHIYDSAIQFRAKRCLVLDGICRRNFTCDYSNFAFSTLTSIDWLFLAIQYEIFVHVMEICNAIVHWHPLQFINKIGIFVFRENSRIRWSFWMCIHANYWIW